MEFLVDVIMSVTWQQLLMYVVGVALIWLAIKKEYEPALLLPMGFGAILVNLPNTGVINQVPVSYTHLDVYKRQAEYQEKRRPIQNRHALKEE